GDCRIQTGLAWTSTQSRHAIGKVISDRGTEPVTRHQDVPRNRDTKFCRRLGGHTLWASSSSRVLPGERPMPRPIPVPLRQAIWRRSQDGQDGPTIAQALGLASRTVRHLLDRFRRGGPAALSPSYDRCGAATPKPAESLVQAALSLRREHPSWGAGL